MVRINRILIVDWGPKRTYCVNSVPLITIDALYDYTLYVRGAYNGPYIRIKHHIYVRAYNHRITNGQRIIPSYDETEFTAHLLLPRPPGH